MEQAFIRAKGCTIKALGKREKCMELVQVNGLIEMINYKANIQENTEKEQNMVMANTQMKKELFLKESGSMEI